MRNWVQFVFQHPSLGYTNRGTWATSSRGAHLRKNPEGKCKCMTEVVFRAWFRVKFQAIWIFWLSICNLDQCWSYKCCLVYIHISCLALCLDTFHLLCSSSVLCVWILWFHSTENQDINMFLKNLALWVEQMYILVLIPKPFGVETVSLSHWLHIPAGGLIARTAPDLKGALMHA